MRNAEWQSTLAAVIERDSEQEERESVYAELGQETLLPDGDLTGFALETHQHQFLIPFRDEEQGMAWLQHTVDRPLRTKLNQRVLSKTLTPIMAKKVSWPR